MKKLFFMTLTIVAMMSMLSCCAIKEEAETEEATEQEQENPEPEQQKTYGL